MLRKAIAHILLFTCTIFLNSCINYMTLSREDLKKGDNIEIVYTSDGKQIPLLEGKYCDKEIFACVTRPDNSIDAYPITRVLSMRTTQSNTINVTELKKDVKIYEAALKDRTIKNINYLNKYDRELNKIAIGSGFAGIDFENIIQARINKPDTLNLDSISIDVDYPATEIVLKDSRYFPAKSVKFTNWGPYFTDAQKTMYINYAKVDSAMVKDNYTAVCCFTSAIVMPVALYLLLWLILPRHLFGGHH